MWTLHTCLHLNRHFLLIHRRQENNWICSENDQSCLLYARMIMRSNITFIYFIQICRMINFSSTNWINQILSRGFRLCLLNENIRSLGIKWNQWNIISSLDRVRCLLSWQWHWMVDESINAPVTESSWVRRLCTSIVKWSHITLTWWCVRCTSEEKNWGRFFLRQCASRDVIYECKEKTLAPGNKRKSSLPSGQEEEEKKKDMKKLWRWKRQRQDYTRTIEQE